MDFMTAFDIGASALSTERLRMNVISMNLANVKTTRTPEGGPYRRKSLTQAATPVESPFARAMSSALGQDLMGVRALDVATDLRPFKMVFEPGHPDADADGYVSYPDINVVEEMTNMLTTQRTYDANVQTIETVKAMYNKALSIGQ